ncbi:MarR family transcriptional regulator [Marivita sp. S6314]|uniref:MarR family winged helix-turn-helix transcriptional regulator n=1 Tax=Marivita sp. S6314 TaxID=2926406 RepID=UPI001FF2C495|nr:MarR family transcriptional regulator [Marivita sp. S6314]MCK0149558.1 MarR family transcriptional regulator [Marivita sp. S6314]
MPDDQPDALTGLYFQLFNEIGIISQLSRALFEARLPDGLLLPHFTVVNHLIRVKDGQTPLTLARAFQVPKTSMTHTLAGLEKRGLIEMRANPDDARSKQVWLTEAGRAFRETAIAGLAPEIGDLSDTLPEEEVREVVARLEALRKRLDAARD